MLRRFQQILLAHKTDIARRITQEAGKPAVEALAHRSSGCARCGAIPDRQRLRDPARRKAAARKSRAQNQVRAHSARALWRDRNHLAVELSFFDSGDGGHGGAGRGQCRRAQALRVDAADCARTAGAAARGGSSRRHFPGASGRRRDGGGAGGKRNRQTGLHRKRRHRAAESRRSPPNACFRWCWNWAARIRCSCSKTPTSMWRRAAPSGERS